MDIRAFYGQKKLDGAVEWRLIPSDSEDSELKENQTECISGLRDSSEVRGQSAE